MAKLIEKKKYYYFSKSYREEGRVVNKEKYLGSSLPENISIVKEEFEKYVREERFEEKIQSIKKNYLKEFNALPKVAKEKFIQHFAVQFTYNSQKIEGSTITLKDTRQIVEDGIAPAKSIKEIEETKEHHRLFLEMLEYKDDITLQRVLYWHKRLFEKSYPQIAGKIREHNVKVAGSLTKFPDHIEVEYLLKEFFEWYEENKRKYNGVELAALVHLKFVSIHPFSDGNGRVSRLIMNYVLFKENYPLLDIPYVDRKSYYNSLEKSNLKEDSNYFIEFIVKKFIKDYKEYV